MYNWHADLTIIENAFNPGMTIVEVGINFSRAGRRVRFAFRNQI
jgi:hypothetical protein